MYLYNYLVCVIAQVILAAIVWHSAYMDERKNKLYLLAIVFNTLTLTGYIGRGLVDGSSLVLLNTLSNLLIYTSSSLAAFFLLLTSLKKDTAIYRTVLVIETVVLLIIVSSPWTKLAFSINEYGLYERGLAYSALSVFDTAYVVLWLGCLAVTYQYVEWKKRAYILLLAELEIAAIIIQIFTSEFKVIHVAAAFLLSIYYAFIMEVEGRYDQMTGVYSKRFYHPEVERLRGNGTYIVFMMDVNGLKTVNDTLGHEKGDMVLQAVGRTVLGVLHEKAKVFRTGGDEFVGFSTSLKESEMCQCVEEIEEKLKLESHKLGFDAAVSIGYAVHHPEEDFFDTLHRADGYMYRAKNEYYEKTGKARRVS